MPDTQSEPSASAARVFFALWPDARVSEALLRVSLEMQRRLDGKATREDSIHMTLLFLGDIPGDRLDALAQVGAGVPFEPFTLRIEKADCWKHNKIGWVAPLTAPPALLRLVESLERRSAEADFRFDVRSFAPHVTLVRKARCNAFDMRLPPIRWEVHDFVLARSQLDRNGSRYRSIGRWPLVPQPGLSV